MTSHHMLNLRRMLSSVFALLLGAGSAYALQFSISTDKAQYYPGEPMIIMVKATNSGPVDVTLHFPTSLQAYYWIDVYTPPGPALQILTEATVPAHGSYTWNFRYSWTNNNLAFGRHIAYGRIEGYGSAGSTSFDVVQPTLPTDNFLVDFDHIPGTTTPMDSIAALSSFGMHFRSIDPKYGPGLGAYDSNQYLTVNTCTYPTGFNIVIDFDMSVYNVTANVCAGGGRGVTLIARAADGTVLDSASVASTLYFTFTESLSVHSAAPIAHLECWPTQTNCAVCIDNLYLVLRPAPGDFDHDGDVDQEDFGHFQACLTEANVAQNDPACLDARLDADEDVDQADYGVFQRCYTGAGVWANSDCGD